jgi:signal transduction histidine kinase
MTVRRLARFSPQHDHGGQRSRLRNLLLTFLLRAVDLVAISIAIFLVAAPFVWRKRHADSVLDRWYKPRMDAIAEVETDWMTLPTVPEFTRGDEPAVREFLKAQPLVAAIQDRRAPHALWIHREGILVKAPDGPLREGLQHLFAEADQSKRFVWFPSKALPDETRSCPKIVLRGDRWALAKRWKEGSPEVERSLRNLCDLKDPFRVVLLKDGDEKRKDFKPEPWGAEPNVQGDPYRAQEAIFSTQIVSNEFPGWSFTVIPRQADALALRREWRIQFYLAIAISCLVGGAVILALYLRILARRKEALDADRLASMTHSLKTPLAVLKFRCDSLRLGRLDPDQLDAQLIKIGEEADHLSGIIEGALMGLNGTQESGPQSEVTAEWLRSVAEDLEPAFRAAGRRLVVVNTELKGKASLPSLRAALFTLVENALYHGEGTVILETIRSRKRLFIKVSDEGKGLGALELKALGRPFMRIRNTGKEGFQHEGQGLGLSLLVKVAEREGWGLAFASEGGNGLCVTLEIHA